MNYSKSIPALGAVLILLAVLPGCQTLRGLAALREVDFALDRVARVELAGVELDRVRSYDDLTAGDVLRLTRAVARREMPLAFTLHLAAENPEDNPVEARLVEMDWTLFLDDRETVSGLFDGDVVLPPGRVRDVPIEVRLDLVDFFEGSAQDLFELAKAFAGGDPKNVRVVARPTIDTPLGPIRYPQDVTIVSRDVGR